MYIRKMRVRNFKSILDSEELSFDRNFVVLAGKNNTGKTALIESIYRCFRGHYMSPGASGGSGSVEGIKQLSDVHLWLLLELTEVEKQQYFNGLPTECWGRYLSISLRSANGQSRVDNVAVSDEPHKQPNLVYEVDRETNQVTSYGRTPTGTVNIPNVGNYIYEWFGRLSEVFIFVGGNRQVSGAQNVNGQVKLDTTAANLHTVLHTLHNNREDAFHAIQSAFIDIFSDVLRIRTAVINQATNIQLQFKHSNDSIPLQECGTGLTHVLIMLCVIFSETSRIVLFDEPHSFLHPSAEKALYDLASKQPDHQFLITTHSPILLNYPIEKELYLVTKHEGESVLQKLNNREDALHEIGISNSDFALSDRVLFVEGPTEEHLLPMLFAKYDIVPVGTTCKLVRLDGTGKEFSKKTAMNKHASMLSRLFSGVSDIKVPYAILLDRDERTEEKISELREAYGSSIVVLNRREIENYMLDPEAIATVLKGYQKVVHSQQIQREIDACLIDNENRTLYPRGCNDACEDVKGGVVLERIFAAHEMEFSKVRDGIAIAREILLKGDNAMDEVVAMLTPFFTSPIAKGD